MYLRELCAQSSGHAHTNHEAAYLRIRARNSCTCSGIFDENVLLLKNNAYTYMQHASTHKHEAVDCDFMTEDI
jgi:hypothetical protein